jgi:3'-phosphoadenosine 5'-phosphosulfate sulfotransferase (PAPS reductase)/FAD synthetase
VVEEKGPTASRNGLQTVTLLDALAELKADAAIGGARRDEEKARAKERFFSHRDRFGQWDPKNQRPELWSLYNGRKHQGEHFRVFPISNWTEMDVWQYIHDKQIEMPSLYFAHWREVLRAGWHVAGRGAVHGASAGGNGAPPVRALPHDRRHDLHRRGVSRRQPPSTMSLPRSPSRASPSAARAPTTSGPRRPWKIASGWGISELRGASCEGRPGVNSNVPIEKGCTVWTCYALPRPAASTTARAR